MRSHKKKVWGGAPQCDIADKHREDLKMPEQLFQDCMQGKKPNVQNKSKHYQMVLKESSHCMQIEMRMVIDNTPQHCCGRSHQGKRCAGARNLSRGIMLNKRCSRNKKISDMV